MLFCFVKSKENRKTSAVHLLEINFPFFRFALSGVAKIIKVRIKNLAKLYQISTFNGFILIELQFEQQFENEGLNQAFCYWFVKIE